MEKTKVLLLGAIIVLLAVMAWVMWDGANVGRYQPVKLDEESTIFIVDTKTGAVKVPVIFFPDNLRKIDQLGVPFENMKDSPWQK